MDRYAKIKERLLSIAEADSSLRAIISIGSSARSFSPADEYSDIDLIIAVENPDEWLCGDRPSELGKIKISFVEPTLGGAHERRMLYDGSLDVDLLVFTPELLEEAIRAGVAAEVMDRGYAVLYDDMSVTELLGRYVEPSVHRTRMSEEEFINTVNDFWFHVVWSAKKILRGELWTAKMSIDAYLKQHLLRILEQSRPEKTDVWHNGRFLERWAGEENVSALAGCFAHYEREDMISALRATAALFSRQAVAASARLGYKYPAEAQDYALSLLDEYFGRAS